MDILEFGELKISQWNGKRLFESFFLQKHSVTIVSALAESQRKWQPWERFGVGKGKKKKKTDELTMDYILGKVEWFIASQKFHVIRAVYTAFWSVELEEGEK